MANLPYKLEVYNIVAIPVFSLLVLLYCYYLWRFKASREVFTMTTIVGCIGALISKQSWC